MRAQISACGELTEEENEALVQGGFPGFPVVFTYVEASARVQAQIDFCAFTRVFAVNKGFVGFQIWRSAVVPIKNEAGAAWISFPASNQGVKELRGYLNKEKRFFFSVSSGRPDAFRAMRLIASDTADSVRTRGLASF